KRKPPRKPWTSPARLRCSKCRYRRFAMDRMRPNRSDGPVVHCVERNAESSLGSIAKSIRDGIAPIPPEILFADLHPWSRLSAFIFSNIEQMFNSVHELPVMTACNNIIHAHFVF